MGDIAAIYTPANLRAMRSTGLRPLSYRLRTELGVEAWHFNPRGRWSDAAHRQGYWVSDPHPDRRHPPSVTYGYRLPRRGNTIDQANNDGYSRLDDGDPRTFWKSNPYLDSGLSSQADSAHPQWAMVDLGAVRPVDAVALDWAAPFATRLQIQYWVGPTPPARNGAERENARFAALGSSGAWQDFPRGLAAGHGGHQLLRVAKPAAPIAARYVRILMTASSHTAVAGARDIRDRAGYALSELRVGRLAPSGTSSRPPPFTDWVRHAPSNSAQSVIWVSSTDPWHRARDLDSGTEQPSFERVLSSGLTAGQPLLAPVPTAYGTPEDAVAELRYLRALGLPLRALELGEEPDGQLIGPEDFAALYVRLAGALTRADPHVTLGGPSLATSLPDWSVAPDRSGHRSWVGRWVGALRALGALAKLSFFSFEWYPFDDVCGDPAPQVARAPSLLGDIVARQRRAGLPASVPLVITEYGYSPFAAQAEVELSGAVLDADIAARFLALGGRTSYLYGYEPDALIRESRFCSTYGNLTLFGADDSHRIRYRTATYFAMRMLTSQWLDPRGAAHRLYPTADAVPDRSGQVLLSAYPLVRPDGRLSVLLVNRDPRRAHTVRLGLRGRSLAGGSWDLYSLGSAQYAWHPGGPGGYPAPDGPAFHQTSGPTVALPPMSVSVARSRLALAG
ncbi:MAG TPA: discoidin domain-containing protein [Solirubrobacteraceae bacterium]|nr:discoidin domain-containing protein [Solirubrobacteraceae bacterium]